MSDGTPYQPVEVKLGGTTYRVRPLRVEDHDELMQWVQNRHIQTARIAAEGLESSERLALLSAASDKAALLTLDSPETLRVLGSLQGAIRMLWMGLRIDHPELDEAKILNLLTDPETLAETLRAMRNANEQANRPGSPAGG